MDDLLQDLIAYAIEKKASDIHFVVQNQKLQIKLRTQNEMLDVYQDIWQPAFFEYLKFISRMDLTNPYTPQSGETIPTADVEISAWMKLPMQYRHLIIGLAALAGILLLRGLVFYIRKLFS